MDLNTLQQTVTHREQLYYAMEIPVTSWFRGWLRWTNEPLPTADAEKHYVIMEMVGTEPLRTTILTEATPSFAFGRKVCDKLLLVRITLMPDTYYLSLQPYRLSDGREVEMAWKLSYQATDTKELWCAHKQRDPLLTLQKAVTESTTKFLGNITSIDLLTTPTEMLTAERQPDQQAGQKRVRTQLESEVLKLNIPGLNLLKAEAIFTLSADLVDYLKTLHQGFYATNELWEQVKKKRRDHAQRQYINGLLDQDTSFAPYNLHEVILALDTALLEPFYTAEDWQSAMAAVHKRLAEKQKASIDLQRMGEIEHLKQWLQMAQLAGLKDDAQRRLQQVILDKMLESRKNQEDRQEPSAQEFLRSLINQGASGAR